MATWLLFLLLLLFPGFMPVFLIIGLLLLGVTSGSAMSPFIYQLF
ncbi:MAG TPA: hypothetical protein PLD47_17785 [Aggregatilineales bacterium]|nr:hypothetical protein [Aggregatilineales bacterium]